MFAQRHPQKLVSDIQRTHAEAFILRAAIDPVTSRNDFLALHNFFNWAISQGYCDLNPVKGVELPQRDEDKLPQILTAEEVRLFLETAVTFRNGKLIPYLVLATLAAIRPTEVSRLTWDDIDLEAKLVMLRKGKLRQRRVVELSENAVEWLLSHAQNRTPIQSKNWRQELDILREMCGFRGPMTPKALRAKERDDLKAWGHDVLRHTGISNHLAFYENEGKTAAWAGNSPVMVHKHYKGLVTRKDAEQFWNIYPKPQSGAPATCGKGQSTEASSNGHVQILNIQSNDMNGNGPAEFNNAQASSPGRSCDGSRNSSEPSEDTAQISVR
jgi:integrase